MRDGSSIRNTLEFYRNERMTNETFSNILDSNIRSTVNIPRDLIDMVTSYTLDKKDRKRFGVENAKAIKLSEKQKGKSRKKALSSLLITYKDRRGALYAGSRAYHH